MRSLFIAAIIFSAFPAGFALAQPAGAPVLDETQTRGRELLNQYCAICHLKPQLGAETYGPPLTQATLGGDAVALRDFIGHGTARMPGFQYAFKPDDLAAVIAYLKTVPAPAPQAH